VDDILAYTDAFEYLRKFYADDSSTQMQTSSSTFERSRTNTIPISTFSPIPKIENRFAAIVDFPKQVIVSLAHAVRHLVDFGLSDAFRTTSFFGKFLTRSHMLLNANSLMNLCVEPDSNCHPTIK
jgi:DNA mismatch repair protein MSH3